MSRACPFCDGHGCFVCLGTPHSYTDLLRASIDRYARNYKRRGGEFGPGIADAEFDGVVVPRMREGQRT